MMQRSTVLVIDALRGLLVVGTILAAVTAAGHVVGPLGLGLDVPLVTPDGDSVTATGTLAEPPAVEGAAPDVVSGDSSPAALTTPFTAGVTLVQPTGAERVAYLAVRVGTALVAAGGMLLGLQILGSTKEAGPFTHANARRLWLVAGVVAIGGTAVGVGDGWIDTFLIQRSVAAELFAVEYTFPLLPLVAGAVLAILAFVWQEGIRMREDTEGLI